MDCFYNYICMIVCTVIHRTCNVHTHICLGHSICITCIHTYIHTHIHVYIHIHIYVYTYTYMLLLQATPFAERGIWFYFCAADGLSPVNAIIKQHEMDDNTMLTSTKYNYCDVIAAPRQLMQSEKSVDLIGHSTFCCGDNSMVAA